MSKIIFTLFFGLLLFFNTKSYSQTSVSYISYEYTEILAYSISFTYSTSSGTYQHYSPYGSMANDLRTLQARYNRNYEIASKEWGKLLELKLINNSNKATLKYYQNLINSEMKINGSGNYGIQSYADEVIAFVTQPFRVESIKNEIKLLQKCNNEIARLKYDDPNGYPLSKRYSSISKVLKKLETCSVDEIGKLNWESIEIEENNKASTSSNSSSGNYGLVTSANLNVRSGASTTSSIITSLTKGDKVEIIEKVNENWTKVKVQYFDKFDNYKTSYGYVYSAYISEGDNDNDDDLREAYEAAGIEFPSNNSTSSNTNSTTGKIIFWTDCGTDGEIFVYVGTEFIGKLTTFYDEAPYSNYEGTVSISKPAGTYKFSAKGSKFSWTGEVSITNGQTVLKKLSK